MRTSITISLPTLVAKDAKRAVKTGGFASLSEYIRHALREYDRAMLARELEEDRRAFDRGEGKVLKSLRDLR